MRPLLLLLFIWCRPLSAVRAQLAAPSPSAPGVLSWTFPVARPHAGVPLGNGTQGLLVWGGPSHSAGDTLRLTVGRAGFWDHRGGNAFQAGITYAAVRRLLEARDEPALRRAFAPPTAAPGQPKAPQQLGGGRLDLALPPGWRLDRATLAWRRGEISVLVRNTAGRAETIFIRQSVNQELAWVELPPSLAGKVTARLVPAWTYVGKQLAAVGVAPPVAWQTAAGGNLTGFMQSLPADDPLAVACLTVGDRVLLATALGANARADATARLTNANLPAARRNNDAWWATYWASVPAIVLPDPVLQEAVDYALYKQACVNPPQGVACTLQGPFLEEYQLPPWSADYHFNINVQMIYQPALATNRLDHLRPLWKMLVAWLPQLSTNGKNFFGREGALLLPHAVDDRCRTVGTFWTGTIDQACTAWMAQLAWQHYRYGMDKAVLTDVAYPLLTGAFEGYWAMLEEVPDGKGGQRLSLPVSVSPEFRGDAMDAWGRDASFQLAALHAVATMLPKAAAALSKPVDPRWADVTRRLPPYATVEAPAYAEYPAFRSRRIALWDSLDLPNSHRHHSHLGSIYPFMTVSPQDPAHRAVVQASLNRWTYAGAGAWTGWCVPWAATLLARADQPDAAVEWLHWWQSNFVNEGRGTLHNANKPGVTMFGSPIRRPSDPAPNNEIMQLDAGFGALTATLELLVQNRADGLYVLPTLPQTWQTLRFDNIRAEGAFLVSARVEGGLTRQVRIKSLVGGPLRLAHGLGDHYTLNGQPATGRMLEKTCTPGEEVVLKKL